MKKILLAVFLFIIMSLQASNAEYYGVKSGKIEFELSGNSSGTKTIWFDDFGNKKRTEVNSQTTIKIFGMENTTYEHTLVILDGKFIYSADLNDNSGSKQAMPTFADLNMNEMSESEKQAYFDEILASLGGEKLGKEKFLGKECDVFSIMGSKSWIYQGIILKSETNVLGITSNETALKIDENISVSSDKFNPPVDIEWYDQTGNMGGLYGEMDYEEEESYSGGEKPGFPYENFAKAVTAAKIPGYNLANVEQDEDGYLAVFMKSVMKSILVSAVYYQPEMLQITDGIDTNSKFNFQGKDAYYTVSSEGFTMLSVVHEESQTMFSIIKMGQMSKDEMAQIMKKFNF